MQAIEFQTTLHNGIVTLPPEYFAQWKGKTIRVIVLDEAALTLSTAANLTNLSEVNPLKGSVIFEHDLLSPIDVSWDAEA